MEEKADVLNDYFSIEISRSTEMQISGTPSCVKTDDATPQDAEMTVPPTESVLIGLPALIPGLKPFPQELPMLMLRLAADIDYSNEEKCIEGVAEELSFYYSRYVDFLTLKSQALDYPNCGADLAKPIDDFKFALEHELLPDMKKHFVVRKKFALFDDLTFSMITCTENLYKVFERC